MGWVAPYQGRRHLAPRSSPWTSFAKAAEGATLVSPSASSATLPPVESVARENADRENAERETMVRYGLMVAEMRAQADEPFIASQTSCKLVTAQFRGDGAVGAL